MNFELLGLNGHLYITDNTVSIVRKGFYATIGYGANKGDRHFDISAVQGIQVKKPGFLCGHIEFDVSGNKNNSYRAEVDRITFNMDNYEKALTIKDYILKQGRKGTTKNFSVADEIEKLKNLLDSGTISKDEFEAQKKKLLSS